MRKLKFLPTKPTYVGAIKKSPYIRQQHYQPDKNKNKIEIKIKNKNKTEKRKLSNKYINIDKNLHSAISDKLKKLGILDKSYYVGGMVRDSLLGKKSKDVDILIEKPTKEDIKKLDLNFEKTGKDFPVYRMKIGDEEIELALARKERKTGEGYKGFEIETGEHINIDQDLLRRDITINSMAVPVSNPEKLIDPFNGYKHLEEGIIKHTSEAFAEDPLRVLRVARFGSRYGFNIHPDTIKMMESLKNELKTISPERIQEELNKMYSQSKEPSKFFDILRKSNTLDVWFPEIQKMIGIEQPKEYHPEGDVYNHTMETINNIRKFGGDKHSFWGALFHDIGKIDTPKEILPKHIEHEKRGLKYVDELAKRYKWSNETKKIVKDSIEFHMNIPKISEMKPSKIIKMVERLYKNGTLEHVLHVSSADRLREGGLSEKVFHKIRVAEEVIKSGTSEDVITKVKEFKKNKKYKEIPNLILQDRVIRFKKMLKD